MGIWLLDYTTAGLPNGGSTKYFRFWYDKSLSVPAGLELTKEIMSSCDSDFLLMSSWFPGVSIPYPINVFVTPETGGARWLGFGFITPLQVFVGMGEQALIPRPLFARYLLVCEVTEMFMRENFMRGWFSSFSEGSKGEALGRVSWSHVLEAAGPLLCSGKVSRSGEVANQCP